MRSLAHLFRRASSALAAIALLAPAAGAQDTLHVGDRVRLRLVPPLADRYPRRRAEGAFVRLGSDSVVLRRHLQTQAFALRDVREAELRVRVRSAGAGALRYGVGSALAGAAVGAFLGNKVGGPGSCTTAPGGTCYESDPLPTRGTAVATGALFGLVGAWYGATSGRWAWSRVSFTPSRGA